MSKWLKFACFILAILMCFSLVSCTNSEEQQEIIDTFNSFESNDNYIFQTAFEFHLGKTVIPNSELTYNGRWCEFLTSNDLCAYGYCQSEDRTTAYIVCLDYEDLTISLCDTVPLPSTLIHSSFYNNSFYFRTDDPSTEEFKQMYTVYDMCTKEISSCTDDFIDLVERRDFSGDYEFDYPDLPLFGNLKMKIINTKTGETKKFSAKNLKNCEEGKLICKLPNKRTNLGAIPSDIFADGDDIYILCLQCIESFGFPSYLFIVKYNFNTNNIEYCSTIYFENYPKHTNFFYIPNNINSTSN